MLFFGPKKGQRMPRQPNNYRTVRIKISTTPAVGAYLEKLVGVGLFGKTIPEVAERLVARGVEALLKDRLIEPPTPAERQKSKRSNS